MYNFFVTDEQIKDNKVTIKGGDYNHIANVLRMKEKDRFFVCNKDNASSYLVEIQNIDKNEVICKIISENESSESKVSITIFQGIPKTDKMEIIIISSQYRRFSPLFSMFYQKSCHTITICCTPAKKGLILQ